MELAIAATVNGHAGLILASEIESAQRYASQAKAASTLRAYASDWRDFGSWCQARGVPVLPALPQTVALYLTSMADKNIKPATMQRRLAAISKAHSAAGYDSPASMRHAAVSEVWKGIKRSKGTAQTVKAPIVTDNLRKMVATLPSTLAGARDRALLLVGFAGAFRRSELVALNVADVQEVPEGLAITLRRSKTDQEGSGRKVAIPYGGTLETCPVRSLKAWIVFAEIQDGPLFRSINRHGQIRNRLTDKSVALIVKKYTGAAALDSRQFSGHSLRAGLVTSAAIAGVSEHSIMRQTGHRSSAMVRRYIRDANLFRENAAARVGL
jgi:site-specific recombinase XerD